MFPYSLFTPCLPSQVYAGCLSEDSDGAKQLAKTGRTLVLKMDVTKQEDLDESFKKIRDDLKSNGETLSKPHIPLDFIDASDN